jgi:hypothetical protein
MSEHSFLILSAVPDIIFNCVLSLKLYRLCGISAEFCPKPEVEPGGRWEAEIYFIVI